MGVDGWAWTGERVGGRACGRASVWAGERVGVWVCGDVGVRACCVGGQACGWAGVWAGRRVGVCGRAFGRVDGRRRPRGRAHAWLASLAGGGTPTPPPRQLDRAEIVTLLRKLQAAAQAAGPMTKDTAEIVASDEEAVVTKIIDTLDSDKDGVIGEWPGGGLAGSDGCT